MVYLTGDTHGHFERIFDFCERFGLTKDDSIIILGDVGLNFYANKTDKKNKKALNVLGPKFFCIHGNHEIRPQDIVTYKETDYWGDKVLYEEEYPNILFAIDGGIYDIPTPTGFKKSIIIGGAYSVDKYYRIARYMFNNPDKFPDERVEKAIETINRPYSTSGFEELLKFLEDSAKENNFYDKCGWWNTEQPNDKTKNIVEANLMGLGWEIDCVLTHTCPIKYEPVEVFLQGLNQDMVDKSTEEWLGKIESNLIYQKWYCGHYHTEKYIDKIRFMFNDFVLFE